MTSRSWSIDQEGGVLITLRDKDYKISGFLLGTPIKGRVWVMLILRTLIDIQAKKSNNVKDTFLEFRIEINIKSSPAYRYYIKLFNKKYHLRYP